MAIEIKPIDSLQYRNLAQIKDRDFGSWVVEESSQSSEAAVYIQLSVAEVIHSCEVIVPVYNGPTE